MSPSLETGSDQRVADGGAGRIRTDDFLLAKQALCQLSYDPIDGKYLKRTYFLKFTLCDQSRPGLLDPNFKVWSFCPSTIGFDLLREKNRLLKKEVIQPQVPLRLPCYDFVPITSFTLGRRFHCWLANALRAKPAFMT